MKRRITLSCCDKTGLSLILIPGNQINWYSGCGSLKLFLKDINLEDMWKVTLKFETLQLLGECMFMLSIQNPVIDYDRHLLTADLTERQVQDAVECKAQIVEQIVLD